MQPRILLVTQTAESTGPTTSLRLLLDHLASSYRVGVLFPGDGVFRHTLSEKGIPFWNFPSLGRRRFPAVLRLLVREGFDLVYTNEASGSSRNVCQMARILGIPFVSHVRSMGWEHGRDRIGHLRAARAVIAVSHACGASVERYVRPGRLHVVHNGIPAPSSPTRCERDVTRTKGELGLTPKTRLVLHVGHFSPRKGQAYALEVMRHVAARDPNAHLCLVGAQDRDPSYARSIADHAAAPGLAGHVSILGFRTDVDRILSAADVVLHTALADPHPRAVLEAMAAGVPVVGFSTDGVAESVVHGETGYLVDRGNSPGAAEAILQVLGDRGTAERMGAAGRQRVKTKFSDVDTAERVGRILDGVLAETLHSGPPS